MHHHRIPHRRALVTGHHLNPEPLLPLASAGSHGHAGSYLLSSGHLPRVQLLTLGLIQISTKGLFRCEKSLGKIPVALFIVI
jgi:hypothetical protein